MEKPNDFTNLDIAIFFIFALGMCVLTALVILWLSS